MKKTPGVIILLVWFMWSTGRDVDNLIRFRGTTDFYIFSINGLTSLYFAFMIGMLLLDGAVVYYLFRPSPKGFYLALSALAWSLIENIVSVTLALSDLQGVREAYATGRELRGLSVRREALDMIFTPQAMSVAVAVVLVLYSIVAFLIVRNRRYFFRDDSKGSA